MQLSDFQKLEFPDNPGVYFFYGPNPQKELLYVGRATSLKDRVRSYFSNDLISTRGPLLVDMVTTAETIEYVSTDSVLEAIILEANQIKKHQPKFNTKEKDDKSFNHLIITKEAFPIVKVIRGKDLIEHYPKNKLKKVFGPYPNGRALQEGLRIIRKIFPFRTEKCQPGQGKPCFDYQIGLCPGTCVNKISSADYGKNIRHLTAFFEGKKQKVLDSLNRDMLRLAKAEKFEQANEVKSVVFALTHIQDISLIKEEYQQAGDQDQKENRDSIVRIESYDIAHTGGKNAIGVMTVAEGNSLVKADYRQFKIKTAKGGDDPGALEEVLRRRLVHTEWSFPNIIIVDGGEIQKERAESVLKELNFDIAVLAVKKDDRHQPEEILGDKELKKRFEKIIILLNSESHRFSLKHHRRDRSKSFLE